MRVYMHYSTILINNLQNIEMYFSRKIQFLVQWDENRVATIFVGDTAASWMTSPPPPKVNVTKLSQLRKTRLWTKNKTCFIWIRYYYRHFVTFTLGMSFNKLLVSKLVVLTRFASHWTGNLVFLKNTSRYTVIYLSIR